MASTTAVMDIDGDTSEVFRNYFATNYCRAFDLSDRLRLALILDCHKNTGKIGLLRDKVNWAYVHKDLKTAIVTETYLKIEHYLGNPNLFTAFYNTLGNYIFTINWLSELLCRPAAHYSNYSRIFK